RRPLRTIDESSPRRRASATAARSADDAGWWTVVATPTDDRGIFGPVTALDVKPCGSALVRGTNGPAGGDGKSPIIGASARCTWHRLKGVATVPKPQTRSTALEPLLFRFLA